MKKWSYSAAVASAVLVVSSLIATSAAKADVTEVTVWIPFGQDSQIAMWNAAASRVEAKNPGINVTIVGHKDMEASLLAINSGTGPDISMANGFGNVGWFCGTGAWKSLDFLVQGANGLNLRKTFTSASLSGTTASGTRCALPFSSEIFGLYYNKTLLSRAGFKKPPTTTTELTAMSKKLTTFDANGDIVKAGFILWPGYMDNGMASLYLGHMFGAKFYDALGKKSAFYTDKAWLRAFQWQKKFVADVYGKGDFNKGFRRVRTFINHMKDEWGTTNDFITGRVAMVASADWMAPLYCSGDDWALNPCDTPLVNFGVAGFPVDPSLKKTHYGSGVMGANPLGISRGTTHAAAAWTVLKGLTTDKTLAVDWQKAFGDPSSLIAANAAGNGVTYPSRYAPWYKIAAHPKSGYHTLANAGEHLDEVWLNDLMSGVSSDPNFSLRRGLQELAARVNQQLARR